MHEVLPGRHLMPATLRTSNIRPSDYAFLSLDAGGLIVAWHREPSASTATQAKRSSVNMPAASIWMTTELRVDFDDELQQTAAEGHLGERDGIRKRMARGFGRMY